MSVVQKTVELEYLPIRGGGPDRLHNHSSYRPTQGERSNCAACSQLENDFTWLRFHDGVAGREGEFMTIVEAMDAVFRDRLAAVA